MGRGGAGRCEAAKSSGTVYYSLNCTQACKSLLCNISVRNIHVCNESTTKLCMYMIVY